MSRQLVRLPADLRLDRAIDDYFLRYDHSAFPVVDNDRTVGLLTLRAVRAVPVPERSGRVVADFMTPLSDVHCVSPATPLERVVETFNEAEGQRVLVCEGDEIVGIISPSDVARWVRRSEELDLREPAPSSGEPAGSDRDAVQ